MSPILSKAVKAAIINRLLNHKSSEQASRAPTYSIGVAHQAGLEDPALSALYNALAKLAKAIPKIAGVLGDYTEERIGIFLPSTRAKLLRYALLDANNSENIPEPGGAEAATFVTINLLEALSKLDAQLRHSAIQFLRTIEWFEQNFSSAQSFLFLESKSDNFHANKRLLFLSTQTEVHANFRLPLPGYNVSALKQEAFWFVRNFSDPEVSVYFGSLRWPSGHTLWLKKNEFIKFGAQRLDVTALDFLLSHRFLNKTIWWIHESEGYLTARLESQGAVARLQCHNGYNISRSADGSAVLVNGIEISEPTDILPNDTIKIGAFCSPLIKILRKLPSQDPVLSTLPGWNLQLEDVTLEFPNGTKGLDRLSIALGAGDLVAVMGPSGCGKSTMVSLLSGQIQPTEGRILFNGMEVGKAPKLAVVPQDDILFENLTVEENLSFAADLRQILTPAGRTQVVEEVLESIGLQNKRDTHVGSVTEKILSGGQRKRLNIGLELTGNSDALLLDEPTSGLSSADSYDAVKLLRAKANAGMLVLAVVHQPSPEIFKLFDKVIILDVGGRLAFFGNTEDATPYFSLLGGYSGSVADPSVILETMGAQRSTLEGKGGTRRTFDPEFWHLRFSSVRHHYVPPVFVVDSQCAHLTAENDENSASKKASTSRVFCIILMRECLRSLREAPSFLASIGVSIGLAFLIAGVNRTTRSGEAYTFFHNDNIPAFCFLALVLIEFLALSASAQEIVKDRAHRMRERLLSIPGWIWIAAKLPHLTILVLIQSIIITIAGFWTLEIPYAFLHIWIALFCCGMCSLALGLAVSCIPKLTERTALAAVPLLLVPQMVLCGADPFGFDKLKHLNWPAKIATVNARQNAPWPSLLMPSRWGFQALIASFRDDPTILKIDNDQNHKDRITAYNYIKGNLAKIIESPEHFEQLLSQRLGRKYTINSFNSDLKLMLMSREHEYSEILADLKDLSSQLSLPQKKQAIWLNGELNDYAKLSLPASSDLFNKSCLTLLLMTLFFSALGASAIHFEPRFSDLFRHLIWRSRKGKH